MSSASGVHSVYSALLVDEQEQVWRRLDRAYRPFDHGQAPRGAAKRPGDAHVAVACRDSNASVGAWLALAWERAEAEEPRDILGASLGLLARFLQLPAEKPWGANSRPLDATSVPPQASGEGLRKCSGRFIVKKDSQLLDHWQSQHVSLIDAIAHNKRERPVTQRKWLLPQKPSSAVLEPTKWSEFLASSTLAVEDDALTARSELEGSLLDIYHAAPFAVEAKHLKKSEEVLDNEKWRESLQFSFFRGGISSR
jgi:hypothetical protein